MSQCVFFSKEGKGFFEFFKNFAVFNVFPLRVHKIVNQMGIFTIRVPLFGHKTRVLSFCYLLNINLNEINLSEGYWIIQIMIIFMVVVIFHMCMSLCINILVKNQKCKK